MFPATLSKDAQNTLALLGKQSLMDQAYLAGGSGLALRLGHRKSIDFDFFTDQIFELVEVKEMLNRIGEYVGDYETPKTLVGSINKIKFSLFNYPYPRIDETTNFEGVKLAGLKDIAAMKLVAITDRGTKKDYVDLYVLATTCFSIEEMFGYYDQKYLCFEVNKLTLLKSLQYFDDADESPPPDMIIKVDWEDVKKFFRKQTILLTKRYL